MKTPRFTDLARYTHAYVPQVATDIRKTFARVRREQSEAATAQQAKVAPIKERKKS